MNIRYLILFRLKTFAGLPALLLVLSLGVVSLRAREPDKPTKIRLLVPAYFYPSGKGLQEWEKLFKAARRVSIVAVVNPDSGPGKKPDPNYLTITRRARKAGLTLVGYVSTRYAKRPVADVKADIDSWVKFYPAIHGIHIDEQASAADKVDYYGDLYRYIRKKLSRAVVFSNPGTSCAQEYLTTPGADVLCLFERDKGFADFQPPEWAARYPARRFAALAYDVATAETMRKYLRLAARKKIGHVYITDARGANPYDRLPSYWEAEVAEVQRVHRANSGR
jgi:hypothetical protein